MLAVLRFSVALTLLFSSVGAHVALDLTSAFFFEEHKHAECIGLLLGCQKFLLRGFEG